MTRDEFEQWYRGTCPGGEDHAKDDALPDAWRGDCSECIWELIQAEVAKRERCAKVVEDYLARRTEKREELQRQGNTTFVMCLDYQLDAIVIALSAIKEGGP